MHVIDGELQAFLDGELDEKRRAVIADHLAGCAECAASLTELRRLSAIFSGAVELLDEPEVVPFVPRGGRAGRGALLGVGSAFLRAAVIVLLVGGVAWGALPGSALRGWAGQLWQAGAALLAGGDGERQAEAAPVVAALSQSAVSIFPDNGEARVVVREPEPGLELRVRLASVEQVTVRWTGRGADPAFSTAAGRLEVVGAGAGEVSIEAPRSARVLVEVGGRVIAVVEGGEVRGLATAELDGDDVVFRPLDGGS